VEINLTFWKGWVEVQKLQPEDVLYNLYLSWEKNPLRNELTEKFNLERKQQVEIERKTSVRKTWKNEKSEQISNQYSTNPYCVGNVCRWLTIEETRKYLKGAVKNNKKMKKYRKRWNKDGTPKISTKQLQSLEELHKRLFTTDCAIIKVKEK
jgi:hypothetical protein